MTDKYIDYTKMSGPELLKACGTDARAWAIAFCQMHQPHDEDLPGTGISVDLMQTWFSNVMAVAGDAKEADLLAYLESQGIIKRGKVDGKVAFSSSPLY
jgi:hypothetical protein